jgi:hypothetical protein
VENYVLLPKADLDTDIYLKPVGSLAERATHEHDERGYERVTRAQRLIEANTPAERHCKFRPGG